MLKLKLQDFDHLMWRTDSLEKILMVGKIEGRRSGQQRVRWLDGISLSKRQEMVKDGEAWRAAVHGSQSWTRLSDWTTRTGEETTQMSLHWRTDEQSVCPRRGMLFSITRTDILVRAVIWMNLKSMPEEARKEKITFYTTPFIWIVQSRQIYWDHWQVAGGWEQE